MKWRIILGCGDFDLGYHCCSSCHEDTEYGFCMVTDEHPLNSPTRKVRVLADLCCKAPSLTREDWARALWNYFKRNH